MKKMICDVCWHKDGKAVDRTWRLSRKNRATGEKIAVDACDKHKNFLKDCDSLEDARKKVHKLVGLNA